MVHHLYHQDFFICLGINTFDIIYIYNYLFIFGFSILGLKVTLWSVVSGWQVCRGVIKSDTGSVVRKYL